MTPPFRSGNKLRVHPSPMKTDLRLVAPPEHLNLNAMRVDFRSGAVRQAAKESRIMYRLRGVGLIDSDACCNARTASSIDSAENVVFWSIGDHD